LSEIGVFYKTIVLKEREDKSDSLIHNWISSHSDYNGLQDTIKSMRIKKAKSVSKDEKKTEAEEVSNEWKRLANFMSNRK